MTGTRWFFHPIFIFILSVLALGTSLFLYIYWYIEASTGLKAVVHRFNLDADQVLASQTWVVILVLSLLVGIILLGTLVIFVYNQKTLQLYRLQNNFINNFTHELKTPVTSLKLFLETFLKHELSAEDRNRYVGYMLQDVTRLSDNISRILDLARLESKSYEGEFIMVSPAEVIESFLADNQRLFAGCRIRVRNESPGPFLCALDRQLFEMLLMNIIGNAIKYNTSKEPTIDITCEIRRDWQRIRFSDNGLGFGADESKKIFKKFYQIGGADITSPVGSGLGLYLSQSIARIHGGKIIAASDGPGKGATFTLLLPGRHLRKAAA